MYCVREKIFNSQTSNFRFLHSCFCNSNSKTDYANWFSISKYIRTHRKLDLLVIVKNHEKKLSILCMVFLVLIKKLLSKMV